MRFTVMIDSDEFFTEFIKKYNEKYGTSFSIVEFHYEEVTFAVVESNQEDDNEIFRLGIAHGKARVKFDLERQICV